MQSLLDSQRIGLPPDFPGRRIDERVVRCIGPLDGLDGEDLWAGGGVETECVRGAGGRGAVGGDGGRKGLVDEGVDEARGVGEGLERGVYDLEDLGQEDGLTAVCACEE